MALKGGQFAIAATATKLTTALGLAANTYIKQVDVKNAALATANLYIGGSTVTNVPANAFVELVAGQAWSKVEGGAPGPLSTDEIFLVGTVNAANIAFITIIT